MRYNKAARKALKKQYGDLEIAAVVQCVDRIGVGHASSSGAASSTGSSLFALPYATERGWDATSAGLRHDLSMSWITLTDDDLVFHKSNPLAMRQLPKDEIERVGRAGVTLRWFDQPTHGLTARVFHLGLPDGSQLFTATNYKAKLRRTTYSDEPDLFVAAFGDQATEIATT